MRLSQERQRAPCGLLVFDGSKAHRRIKLRRQDWRYAVCKLAPGEVYVNTSGVYGIASAQWWWGSQGACLHRLVLAMAGRHSDLFGFLYVDDWLWMLKLTI